MLLFWTPTVFTQEWMTWHLSTGKTVMMAIHSLTLRCVTFNIGVADEKQWGHDKYAKAFKPGWKDFVETRVKDLHTKPKNPHLGCGINKKTDSRYTELQLHSQNTTRFSNVDCISVVIIELHQYCLVASCSWPLGLLLLVLTITKWTIRFIHRYDSVFVETI